MRKTNKQFKLTTFLLAAMLVAAVLVGCSSDNNSKSNSNSSNQDDNSVAYDQAAGGDKVLKFKPSEQGVMRQEKYEYPYMGLTAELTEPILDKMEGKDVIMLQDEDVNEDATLKYAALSWYTLTEEQKNEEVTAFDPDAWRKSLGKIGVLGVYHTDSVASLDELTGCTEHTEIGKSEDGNYVYYLSFAEAADEDLKKELEKTKVTFTKMEPIDLSTGTGAFSDLHVDASNVGDFKTTDIEGNAVTKDIFAENDLTLVNVFATWCGPCVQEMPELAKLHKEMADKKVGVVAVVMDALDMYGNVDEDVLGQAKVLKDRAKVTFPMLVPDGTAMNGQLIGINSVPTSFFVDKDGNIVGETYVGARDLEGWKEIIEQELKNEE